MDVANWRVVLGEYNQYLEEPGEQSVLPDRFIVHPGFRPHETREYNHYLEKPGEQSVLPDRFIVHHDFRPHETRKSHRLVTPSTFAV